MKFCLILEKFLQLIFIYLFFYLGWGLVWFGLVFKTIQKDRFDWTLRGFYSSHLHWSFSLHSIVSWFLSSFLHHWSQFLTLSSLSRSLHFCSLKSHPSLALSSPLPSLCLFFKCGCRLWDEKWSLVFSWSVR